MCFSLVGIVRASQWDLGVLLRALHCCSFTTDGRSPQEASLLRSPQEASLLRSPQEASLLRSPQEASLLRSPLLYLVSAPLPGERSSTR
ncbi:hypothetical protein NHX12_007984 [Muraenolepis orangiensis]|uniref:Uncharacterized protein n=1 Tax=Muraenolepis orangiensis TaxID=630683 RepID=A0A9Q0DP14_9TELE|nr:hypothetical protein NHX12_007984 [Muraenolepis orangiensis]